MKKYALIAVILVLTVFNLVASLNKSVFANNGGNMGCKSLAGCRGGATCESPGGASGCVIACNNGASIVCPTE